MIGKLHGRLMELARERGVAQGRKMRVDTTVVESLGEFYPEALWQRCAVHFYRNVWTAVPTSKVKEVAAMLKAIHAPGGSRPGAAEGRASR